jgi:hypothetical protein
MAGLAANQTAMQQAMAASLAALHQQAATREAAAAARSSALERVVAELRLDMLCRKPVSSDARLADVLPFIAAAGYVRAAGAAAATSRETWKSVPPGLSPEEQRRVRRDGLLWQVLVKARYKHKLSSGAIDGGWTRLMWAARFGKLARVVELCDWGTDVNAASECGLTALWEASAYGHLACVRELLARGAAVDAADMGVATPLFAAAQIGHVDCVRELLARGADVNKRRFGGWTPLMMASKFGESACLSLLLEAGADKSLLADNGDTAHSLAGAEKPATTAAIRALLDAAP